MQLDALFLEACRFGTLETAKETAELGASMRAVDRHGRTALWLACIHGHLDVAEFLVSYGADVNQTLGKRGNTLLHWAAENSAFGVARFLLDHKANVNAQRADGSTPLMLAAELGHDYVVQLLLKYDALLTPRNSQRATARSLAHEHGHTVAVGLIDTAAESRPARLHAAERAFHTKPGERFLF